MKKRSKMLLLFCLCFISCLFVGVGTIASADIIGKTHDEQNAYTNASYEYSDTYEYEDSFNYIATRTFNKTTRKVTTLLTAGSSGIKLDVMCRIGSSPTEYDFDRQIMTSSAFGSSRAAESLSIFKNMNYTGHFVKADDPAGYTKIDYAPNEWENYSVQSKDNGFKGRWEYK